MRIETRLTNHVMSRLRTYMELVALPTKAPDDIDEPVGLTNQTCACADVGHLQWVQQQGGACLSLA